MIPTPDNEKLSAFYIRVPKSRAKSNLTILMFHGNAGNIGHRVPIARALIESIGCNVFMLEYRGYGLSTGSADETGLMIDAQTGYDYLRKRAETRDHDIVIFGQSLGGAVAVRLAAKNQADNKLIGLVLENTFLSMRKLIPSYVPSPTILKHQANLKGLFHLPSISHSSAIKSGHPTPSSLRSQCLSCSFPVCKTRSSRKYNAFHFAISPPPSNDDCNFPSTKSESLLGPDYNYFRKISDTLKTSLF